jgi:hypothetical protein
MQSACAGYIVICGLPGFTICFFPHCLVNGTVSGGGVFLNLNVCFDFLHNSETFLILRKIQRDVIVHVDMCRYTCIVSKVKFTL